MRCLLLFLLPVLALSACGPRDQSDNSKAEVIASPKPSTVKKVKVQQPITIAWGGDVTPGSQYGLPANNGKDLLAAAKKRLIGADIAAVNLEGTLGSGGASKCSSGGGNCFAFQAPHKNVAVFSNAGVDIVNLANNHSNDFGPSGLRQTKKALRGQGIKYSGQPGQISYLRKGHDKVAFVGFAPYRWTAPLNNLPAARRLIKRAARNSDLVVVFIHGGAEGSDKTSVPYGSEIAFGENRGDLRKFTHRAVDAGADLVVGSGPHVLRGIELYHGRVIAYSLANLAGYHNFGTGGDSALSGIISFTLAPSGRPIRGRFLSLRLGSDNIPFRDQSDAAASLVSRLSRQDFDRRAVRVTLSGRIVFP